MGIGRAPLPRKPQNGEILAAVWWCTPRTPALRKWGYSQQCGGGTPRTLVLRKLTQEELPVGSQSRLQVKIPSQKEAATAILNLAP